MAVTAALSPSSFPQSSTGRFEVIFRRDHPSRPKAMIYCFLSSFKTFAMLREATYPPAAVNVLDVSSESMAAFQVFLYGRFWVFTEGQVPDTSVQPRRFATFRLMTFRR